MKPLLFCLTIGIVVSAWAAAPLAPQDLAAQLRGIKGDLDSKGAGAVLAELPPAWDVASSEHRYSVSTEPLRALLKSAEADDLREAKRWLDAIAQQLESFSKAPMTSPATARSTLSRILARPEFRGVHPPTAWELFRQRVAVWIGSLIERLFTFAAQHPTEGRILFWIVVVGAVGLLAAWIIRLWSGRDARFTLPRVDGAVRMQSWMDWVRAAREAANQGDPREAIRCTYWAGVALLQERRVLPQDLTRTPREYLRLIPAPERAMAAPLGDLTAGLERFWYAGQTAQPDDFEVSLKQLEALGCKLD
jgi:Domain of unknown function (DUF4129)